MHKCKTMKENKSAILRISEASIFCDFSVTIDTKGPKDPASEGNVKTYLFVERFK